MFYKKLHNKFLELVKKNALSNLRVEVKTRALKAEEAIGNPDRKDFPLLKGKEVLMEARFKDAIGQAYTDMPTEFSGTLKEIVNIDIKTSRDRALYISVLNAVVKYIYEDIQTIHCRNNEPEECSKEIAGFIDKTKYKKIGQIGLQPSILEAIANKFGAENVLCVDRDEDNKGIKKFGVDILWGDLENTERIFRDSDFILCTGTTVVNASIIDMIKLSEKYKKPLYFYGTTISGAASLMDLKRLCYKSH